MPKISKSQKKILKNEYKKTPLPELAKKIGISEKEILSYIEKSGKDIEKIAGVNEEEDRKKYNSVKEILSFIKNSKLLVSALFLFVTAIYFNSLTGQLVADDITGFRDNPQITDIAASLSTWRIQPLVYAISYRFFGINSVPLHVWSLAVHAINVLLVFVLASILFGKKTGALSAFLFSAFPVNTEAVSWISAINYSMETALFLISAIFFVIYKNSGKKVYLKWTGAVYLFSIIFIRGNFGIAFVPLLFLIDRFIYPVGEEQKKFRAFLDKRSFGVSLRNIAPLIPLVIFNLLFRLGGYQDRVVYLAGSSEANISSAMPYLTRFPYTLFSNFKLLFYPANLSIFHEGDVITDLGLFLMWVFTILFFWLAYYLSKKRPEISGLLLFIPVSLILTFSPILISSYYSERYLYLGSVGFCMLMGYLLNMFEDEMKIKNLSIILAGVLLSFYSYKVVTRNTEWATPERLWLSAVREVPNSPRAYKALADYYIEKMDFENAMPASEKALNLRNGNYPAARNNLGLSYLRAGNYEEAEKHFMENIRTYPQMWQSYFNMSEIEANRNNIYGAVGYLEKVLNLDPGNERARMILERMKADIK